MQLLKELEVKEIIPPGEEKERGQKRGDKKRRKENCKLQTALTPIFLTFTHFQIMSPMHGALYLLRADPKPTCDRRRIQSCSIATCLNMQRCLPVPSSRA